MSKKIEKVEFASGCFDDFDGTQEELDALVKEIENKFIGVESSKLDTESVSIEDVWDDLDEETQYKIIEQLKQIALEKAGVEKKLN